jgi:predicted O-methyltransferase YrrM
MYQILSYIKFLFGSTNHHGVHSPFVFDFITKCLYDKSYHLAYDNFKAYYDNIISSDDVLDIIDLGEGSKTLNSKSRKVKHMAKMSSSSLKKAKILYRTSKYFDFRVILELGTSLGMASYTFAIANVSSKITTIEGCSNTANYTSSLFDKFMVKNINLITGSFAETIPTLPQKQFDCIYFDGHHNKNATLKYFKALLPKTHNDSVFIFDDIYWSRGMTEAWEFIKAHKAVTVSVDIFHFGFVFFRKEQTKEHFKIRL